MKLFNMFKKAEPELIKEPEKFPNFNNVPEWMEEKVSYYSKKYPDNMYMLFCPSFADYLPLNVTAATSREIFFKNIELYRDIKKRYPEAVEEAKKHITPYNTFNGGDNEDYPKDGY